MMACSVEQPKLEEPGRNIRRRVDRALETFPFLPDTAVIGVRVVSALLGRSTASVWRDVAHGRLARPVRIGGSTPGAWVMCALC